MAFALVLVLLAAQGVSSPLDIPSEMQDPAFWIATARTPDAVFMADRDVHRVNDLTRRRGYRVSPHEEDPWVEGRRIRKAIEEDHRELHGWRKYDTGNVRLRDPAFNDSMVKLTRPGSIPRVIRVSYGVTVRRSAARMMPIDRLIQRRPDDPGFDILLRAVIEVGIPVTVYCYDATREWAYVQTPHCSGWMRREDVATDQGRDAFREFLEPDRRVVITAREEHVCSGPDMEDTLTKATMGTTLPLVRREKKAFVVRIPVRGEKGHVEFREAWIPDRGGAREGFLPLTVRNLVEQAFAWKGAGYRWGHSGEGVDCSGFILSIFKSFGILLHRNSDFQIRSFEIFKVPPDPVRKAEAVSGFVPFRTLLRFPGHIALYLGRIGGRDYVIHALYSYWAREGGTDIEIPVGRVLVSDLSVGQGGKSGSLFDKLDGASIID